MVASAQTLHPGTIRFDPEHVDRIRLLATKESASNLEIGDLVLAEIPASTDDDALVDRLRRLSELTGIEADILQERRFTAQRTPPHVRAPNVAYSVYYEIAKTGEATERTRLQDAIRTNVPITPSGRWTVSALRVLMGRKSMTRATDPIAERLEVTPIQDKADLFERLHNDPEVRAELTRRAVEAVEEDRVSVQGEQTPTSSFAEHDERVREFRESDVPSLYDAAILGWLAFGAAHAAGDVADAIVNSPHTTDPTHYSLQAAEVREWFAEFGDVLTRRPKLRVLSAADAAEE